MISICLSVFFFHREIDVESDDETLYQSKRSSQIKRDQHSSLPDLTESLNDSNNTNDISQISDHIEPSSSTSSVPTSAMLSPTSPINIDSKRKGINPAFLFHENEEIVVSCRFQPIPNTLRYSYFTQCHSKESKKDGKII